MQIRARGHKLVKTSREVAKAWMIHLIEMADSRLFGRINSLYMVAKLPGKLCQLLNYPNTNTYFDNMRRREAKKKMISHFTNNWRDY